MSICNNALIIRMEMARLNIDLIKHVYSIWNYVYIHLYPQLMIYRTGEEYTRYIIYNVHTLEINKNNIICSFGSRSFKWIFHNSVFIDFVYFGWLAAGKNTHKSREIRRGKDEHFRLLACVPDHHIVVVVVAVRDVCLSLFLLYILIFIN